MKSNLRYMLKGRERGEFHMVDTIKCKDFKTRLNMEVKVRNKKVCK